MSLPQTPSLRLDGRRAVVTGAGQGIGFAFASGLAAAGAEVVLAARTQSTIEEAAAAIRGEGHAARAAVLDVTDADAVAHFFAGEEPFDVLVNNAGTNRPKRMQDIEPADFDTVFALNVRAAFFVAQACARRMIDAGRRGSLIHISSQMGHVGAANRSLYCGSKWALEGMSKAFALDLAPHGIRSNTVGPTFVETPMTRPFLADPAFRDTVLGKIKLGRLGQPEDIMGAVLFLASEASALMTGSSIVIDGGWTAE